MSKDRSGKIWLAVYTQPRWEKKVTRLLEERQLEAYCPLNIVYRKWSDRMKKVEEPLFKSYVFVHVCEAEHTAVRMTPGVINFVYWLGKPAVIRDHEITTIRQFLDEHEEVEALRSEELKPGSRLLITSGVMMEQEATALKVGKRYVEVVIKSIGYTLRAKVERTKLKRIG